MVMTPGSDSERTTLTTNKMHISWPFSLQKLMRH